jgi:glc operon protein GlcG
MRLLRSCLLTATTLLLAAAPLRLEAQLADAKVLTAEAVKTLLTAAEAKAKASKWNMSFAVVDAGGELLGFLRLDGASAGTAQIAVGKARTSARFGRPTKVYADRVLSDTLTFLSVDGLVSLQGGLPIVINGRVIGAMGVSGGTSQQDEEVAAAAIALIKP